MKRIAVLRPEPGNAATISRAHAMGLVTLSLPMFRAVALDWDAPAADGFDALLLTSAATMRLSGKKLDAYRDLPAFAVGASTAEAARAAGLNLAQVGNGGAAALMPMLIAAGHARVLHPCALEAKPFNAGALCIRHLPVYRMETLELSGVPALLAGNVALLHSPRAAARLAALVPLADRADIDIVAISATAAQAAGVGWHSIAAAPTPDDEAMLALAAALCDN